MIVEPELVWHPMCPKMTDGDNPLMELSHRLDDIAGHQRVYQCPKCNTVISVNFPPTPESQCYD